MIWVELKICWLVIHVTLSYFSTYHFLQTVDEVTDDNTQSFELVEHGAKFLTGAFTHIWAKVIRLLTYDVGGDGGPYVYHFCALSHSVRIIWKKGEVGLVRWIRKVSHTE